MLRDGSGFNPLISYIKSLKALPLELTSKVLKALHSQLRLHSSDQAKSSQFMTRQREMQGCYIDPETSICRNYYHTIKGFRNMPANVLRLKCRFSCFPLKVSQKPIPKLHFISTHTPQVGSNIFTTGLPLIRRPNGRRGALRFLPANFAGQAGMIQMRLNQFRMVRSSATYILYVMGFVKCSVWRRTRND
ncbi:hypothetical protein GQX74_006053 [Glossina fuscipes]|nr:hypothetical protein GQX74_006053 [Glossina fuscipes]